MCFQRDEWAEAIQMVADKLQRQEEERIQCSPTSQIDNMGEEEMDTSISHHKRKVPSNTDFDVCCGHYKPGTLEVELQKTSKKL